MPKTTGMALNESCRKVTGCVTNHLINNLYNLSGIASPFIHRTRHSVNQKLKQSNRRHTPQNETETSEIENEFLWQELCLPIDRQPIQETHPEFILEQESTLPTITKNSATRRKFCLAQKCVCDGCQSTLKRWKMAKTCKRACCQILSMNHTVKKSGVSRRGVMEPIPSEIQPEKNGSTFFDAIRDDRIVNKRTMKMKSF